MRRYQTKEHKNYQITSPLIKPRQVSGRLFVLAALLFLALTLNAAPVAHAATITVCASGCDHTTITAAIAAASAGDTITVQAGTYTEAGITVNKNLTITGAAASTTIVQAHAMQGSATDRVFWINPGVTAILENLTIRHGQISDLGGGIRVDGTLTLNDSVVQHNSTSTAGGGIYSYPSSTLTLNNSTVSNNTASNLAGGGLVVEGVATVNNSTISGNTASADGSGFVVVGFSSSLTLNNSTVTGNTINNASGSGGIGVLSGSVTIKNSIIIGNVKNGGTGQEDCSGTITSQGYNLVGSGTGCPSSGTGDLTTSNPANELSATLADNGGPTPTHALLPGSAAIDQIANGTNECGQAANGGNQDQRGISRPQSCECDIGAYEFEAATKTWDGDGGDNNWSTAANWNLDTLPLDSDLVQLDSLASTNITLDTNVTIGSLILSDADVTINGGSNTLTLCHYNQSDGIFNAPSTLNVSGNLTHSGGTFNESSNTVTFNGPGAQTIGGSGTTFNNLTINNSSADTLGVSLSADQTVNGTLTLSDGLLKLGSNNLTLGASASVGGTPSAANMIVADGSGQLRKQFNANGSFTFPVGDATGTTEYSPATIDCMANNYAPGAYLGVNLENSKHASNTSSTHYLNRSWSVTNSGISDYLSCHVTFTYVDADINGTESNIYGGKYDSGSGNWTLLNQAETNGALANQFNGTVTSFSDFTGGEQVPLAVELAAFSAQTEGTNIRVSWQTVSEVDNLGFNLYRSTSLDGAQEQLNGSLIPAQAPGSGQGAAYEWQDETVAAGMTYYYWLADVDLHGVETRHGAVSATANTPTAIKLDSFQNTTTLPLWALLSLSFALLVGGWRMLRRIA